MGYVNDLNRSDLPDILRRLRALEMGTPLNSASIGEGGLLVYDGGVITIENGGLDVTGTATISGTLSATGTINMEGTFTATGHVNLNGPTAIAGDTTITGTLAINGVSTLNDDLTVQGGGKIHLGGMTLDPITDGGSIVFAGGGGVQGSGGVAAIRGSGNAGLITSDTASLFAGASSLDVKATGITINGALSLTGIGSTTQPANLYYDPVGKRVYYTA